MLPTHDGATRLAVMQALWGLTYTQAAATMIIAAMMSVVLILVLLKGARPLSQFLQNAHKARYLNGETIGPSYKFREQFGLPQTAPDIALPAGWLFSNKGGGWEAFWAPALIVLFLLGDGVLAVVPSPPLVKVPIEADYTKV
jgi:hypothetical protein